MIIQRLVGWKTQGVPKLEQLLVSDARLIVNDWDEDPAAITLELDIQQNDPKYKQVQLKLMGEATFVKKDGESR